MTVLAEGPSYRYFHWCRHTNSQLNVLALYTCAEGFFLDGSSGKYKGIHPGHSLGGETDEGQSTFADDYAAVICYNTV